MHRQRKFSFDVRITSLIDQGRFQEALPLALQQARERDPEAGGPESAAPGSPLLTVDDALALESLGVLHRELGQYPLAEPPLLQALSIRAGVQGKTDPAYASTLHELARLYEETGQYTGAERLYRSALDIRRQVLGLDHPDVARSLHDLGALLDLRARYDEADDLLRQARDIRLRVLGENHPDYALSLTAQAYSSWRRGRVRHSEALARRAVDILRATRGAEHPDHVAGAHLLSRICLHQAHIGNALELALSVADVRKRVLGERHHRYAAGLENLALVRSVQGQTAEAERLARQGVDITRAALGARHTYLADSLAALAYTLQAQKNYAEAGSYYLQAMEIYRAIHGENHSHLASCSRDLAEVCATQQRYPEAEEHYRKALRILQPLGEACVLERLETQQGLARVLSAQNRQEEAEQLARDAVDQARLAGDGAPMLMAASLDGLARVYQAQGRLADAEPLWREVIACRGRALGEQHPLYAESLRCLAGLHLAQGNFASATELEEQALEILQRCLGPGHPQAVQALCGLAETCWQKGDLDRAETLFTQAVESERNRVGEYHPDHARAVQQLARLYVAMFNVPAAEVRYRQVLNILERVHGSGHPETAGALHDLASLHHQVGDLGNAEILYQRACEIRARDPGEDHPDYAHSLHGLAMVYQAAGRLDEAGALFEQAGEILAGALGEDNPNTLRLRHSQALFEQARGHVTRAVEQLTEVRDRLSALVGENAPLLTPVLGDLARLHGSVGNHLEAEPLWRQILQINQTGFPTDTLLRAQDHVNLALCLRDQAEFAEAEELVRQAAALLEEGGAAPADGPAAAASAPQAAFDAQIAALEGMLAGLVLAAGRVAEAEPLYRAALERTRTALGQYHPAQASILAEYAALCAGQGRADEAQTLYSRAREIIRRSQGEDHPEHVNLLRLIGGLHQAAGQFEEAEQAYRQRLTILRRLFGPNSTAVVPALQLLADVLRQRGHLDEAESASRQAAEIMHGAQQTLASRRARDEHPAPEPESGSPEPPSEDEEFPGPDSPFTEESEEWEEVPPSLAGEPGPLPADDEAFATSSGSPEAVELGVALAENNLATLYLTTGRTEDAEPLLRRSLATLARCVGEDHPAYTGTLMNLATLFIRTDRRDELLSLFEQLTDQGARHLPQLLTLNPERFRAFTCQSCHENFEAALSLGVSLLADPAAVLPRKGRPPLPIRLYDLVLRWKRFGIDVLARPVVETWARKYPQHAVRLNRLHRLDRQIASKRLSGPGPERLSGHRRLVAAWLEERNRLEEQLTRQIPELMLRRRLRMVETGNVVAALPPGWALVEFVHVRRWSAGRKNEGTEQVTVRPLSAAGVLPPPTPLAARERWPGRYVAFVLREAEPRVIDLGPSDPIDERVRAWREALESGRLADAAGAAIREVLWDSLLPHLEGCQGLVVAPDGELLHLPVDAVPFPGGDTMAGRFMIRQVIAGRDLVRWPAGPPAAGEPLLLGGPLIGARPSGWASRLAAEFRRWTSRPAAQPAEQVARSLGASVWLGAEASARRLLERTSPGGRESAPLPPPALVHLEAPLFVAGEPPGEARTEWQNPLEQSGVVLAGGECVTSKAITGLDLWQTNLVMLPAFATPAGRPMTWPKVSGLVSALVFAGARNVVLTLWQAPDVAHREMVTAFYRHLREGRQPAEALRLAKLEVRQRHPEPRCWAGWICVGEPT